MYYSHEFVTETMEGRERLTEQWSLFITRLSSLARKCYEPLFTFGSVTRAVRPVLLLPPSLPPSHPSSSFIWILRAVNESRPIKFLFQVGCRGVITRARYAISAASPPFGLPLLHRWHMSDHHPLPVPVALQSAWLCPSVVTKGRFEILPNRSLLDRFPFFLSVRRTAGTNLSENKFVPLALESHDDSLSG